MPAMSERELGQLAGGNAIAEVTTDIGDCAKTEMQRVRLTAALGTIATFEDYCALCDGRSSGDCSSHDPFVLSDFAGALKAKALE